MSMEISLSKNFLKQKLILNLSSMCPKPLKQHSQYWQGAVSSIGRVAIEKMVGKSLNGRNMNRKNSY